MKERLQKLYNEHSRRELEIEQKKKILQECIDSINSIMESMTPEVKEIINAYSPDLLPLLDTSMYTDLSKAEELKSNLSFVIAELFKHLEGELL